MYARRVVCDGGDAAALSGAVAREVDGAGGRRGVFCVDEAGAMFVSESRREIAMGRDSLIGRAEFSCRSITVIIRPTGN